MRRLRQFTRHVGASFVKCLVRTLLPQEAAGHIIDLSLASDVRRCATSAIVLAQFLFPKYSLFHGLWAAWTLFLQAAIA